MFGLKYLKATWPPLRHDWKHRGTWAMIKDLYQMREFKWGWLRGVDMYGNRYYENPHHTIGTRRWVIYPHSPWKQSDPADVTPTWDMWIHQQFEETPDEMPQLTHYSWMRPPRKGSHLSRMGYEAEYVPRGYYTRQVGVAAREMEEMYAIYADRKPDSLPEKAEAGQLSSSWEGTDMRVNYTSESATSGPSAPPTPSESSPATDPNEGGSAHTTLTRPLYEPWSKLKRSPQDEPVPELR